MKLYQINQLIDELAANAANATTKRDIDKLITVFYRKLVGYTDDYRKGLIKKAIKKAMSLGLSKQDAVRMAHFTNFITSRYDKDGNIIRTSYDIVEAFNQVPKNITREVKGQLMAWHQSKREYMFGKAIKDAGIGKKAMRHYTLLAKTYTRETVNTAKFFLLPDNKPIVYISKEDERRDEVCGALHGTVFSKKSDIPVWARPQVHFGCRCKLVAQGKTKADVRRVPCNPDKDDKAGRAMATIAKEMLRRGGNRDYGQGYSNFKKIKENGKCYYEYVTISDS